MKINGRDYRVINIIKETNYKKVSTIFFDDDNFMYLKEFQKPYKKEIYQKIKDFPHPFITEIIEISEIEDLKIVEKHFNGKNLSEIRSFDKQEVKTIFKQLIKAIKHLHSFDPPIIHRDIKPENILYNGEKICLIDFDISRESNQNTKDTLILGTVGYAAPEQYGFTQSDIRTDIYSMGILLNYLTSNKEKPIKKYKRIIKVATSMDPEMRYQNINQLEMAFNTNGLIYDLLQIPGFRKKNPISMILALMYLGFAIYGFFATLLEKNVDFMYRFNGYNVVLVLIATYLVFGNYMNCLNRLFRTNRISFITRIIMGVITFFMTGIIPRLIVELIWKPI